MSPEQVQARELDARSDLFSFGAVLYEMATGRQAFGGGSAGLVFDAILNRPPEPPLQLDPNRVNAHAYHAHLLTIVGRTDEALIHSERAIELDPFNALSHGLYALVLRHARRHDDALAAARAALAIQPDAWVARGALQGALIDMGRLDEQLALQREQITGDAEQVAALEQGLAEAGWEGAQRRVGDLLAARYDASDVASAPRPKLIAMFYRRAGDSERALDWLERGYEDRDPSLPYTPVDPLDAAMRSNPRFQDLLRRMNLTPPPEQ
jgi:tetratricopeptide (TPR) repeat protein